MNETFTCVLIIWKYFRFIHTCPRTLGPSRYSFPRHLSEFEEIRGSFPLQTLKLLCFPSLQITKIICCFNLFSGSLHVTSLLQFHPSCSKLHDSNFPPQSWAEFHCVQGLQFLSFLIGCWIPRLFLYLGFQKSSCGKEMSLGMNAGIMQGKINGMVPVPTVLIPLVEQ